LVKGGRNAKACKEIAVWERKQTNEEEEIEIQKTALSPDQRRETMGESTSSDLVGLSTGGRKKKTEQLNRAGR